MGDVVGEGWEGSPRVKAQVGRMHMLSLLRHKPDLVGGRVGLCGDRMGGWGMDKCEQKAGRAAGRPAASG